VIGATVVVVKVATGEMEEEIEPENESRAG